MIDKIPQSNHSRFLEHLSTVYGSVIAARNYLYDREILPQGSCSIPTICVGNIIAGGSGKSPMCHFLASKLALQGKRVALLSRGYGGSIKGPHVVDGSELSHQVGDETIMHRNKLGENCTIVIARNRLAGARFIESHDLADVIVLDDGFQHRKLLKDMNFLLLDVSSAKAIGKWNSKKLLPWGLLREPLQAGIKRANAIVLINKDPDRSKPKVTPLLQFNIPQFQFHLRPSYLYDVVSGERLELEAFCDTRVRAMSGIASPGSFHRILRKVGYLLEDTVSFKDHYEFTKRDWDEFSSNNTAPFICTEKDAVKLRHFCKEKGRLFALVLDGNLANQQEKEQFWSMIQKIL